MAMSTRATKRRRISPQPPPPSVRSTPLDKFPNIVELIVKYSSASCLVQLRLTSRALKDLADRRFPTHISIEADGMILAKTHGKKKTQGKQRISWRPRVILPCLVRYVDLKPAPDEDALTPCTCDTGPHETHHVRFIAEHLDNVDILRHADNACTEPLIEAQTCVVSCNGYERLATDIADFKSSNGQDPPEDNIRNLGVTATLSYAAIGFTKLVVAFKRRPFGMFPFKTIKFTGVPDHVNKVTILLVQDAVATLSVDDLSFDSDSNYQNLTAGLVAFVCEELHRRKSPPKFTVIGVNKWKRSWLPPDIVQPYPRAITIETIFKDVLEETLCQQYEYSEREADKALKKVTFMDRVSYTKKNGVKEFEMESGH